MKLILKKDLDNLGAAGEIVDVKPGYGRNYLIPQGLAYAASEANLARVEEEQAKADERAKREYLEARRRAAQLENMVLVFRERAGEDGKLFGSVTAADVAELAIAQGLDYELDKRLIVLEEPIKALGEVTVAVRLHKEVDASIEVRVEAEGG